jgi:hypothetical protein
MPLLENGTALENASRTAVLGGPTLHPIDKHFKGWRIPEMRHAIRGGVMAVAIPSTMTRDARLKLSCRAIRSRFFSNCRKTQRIAEERQTKCTKRVAKDTKTIAVQASQPRTANRERYGLPSARAGTGEHLGQTLASLHLSLPRRRNDDKCQTPLPTANRELRTANVIGIQRTQRTSLRSGSLRALRVKGFCVTLEPQTANAAAFPAKESPFSRELQAMGNRLRSTAAVHAATAHPGSDARIIASSSREGDATTQASDPSSSCEPKPRTLFPLLPPNRSSPTSHEPQATSCFRTANRERHHI